MDIYILVKIKFKRQFQNGQRLKNNNENVKLHMIGKLQSNKAKDAVNLFDFIHSLDNQKLSRYFS